MQRPLQEIIERLYARLSRLEGGEVATYIPQLGTADPARFAICCATVDGETYTAGDAEVAFTIQSISKPFVYGLALNDLGAEGVTAKVGLEPSGEAFNAISLDPDTGRPRNPMINAGAIATASLVAGESSEQKMDRVVELLSAFAGRPLDVEEAVFHSERDTGHRNRAIAYLLRNAGILGDDVDDVLDRYFRQCSVLVTAADLGMMAATLAAGGRNPVTGAQIIGFDHVQRVLSVMSTCGMYDYAGSWLYRVGMPAKSGVAGGVLAVLPGQLGIGVFSPALDPFGNSVRGVAACDALSEEFGLHMLRPPLQPSAVIARHHTLAEAGSKRRRTDDEIRLIAQQGRNVQVFRLQGPLAFATAEVALRHATDAYTPAGTIVFDCRRVDRADAATFRLLEGFVAGVRASGGAVLVCALRGAEDWRSGSCSDDEPWLELFDDVDAALESCEDRLIAGSAPVAVGGERVELAHHPMLRTLNRSELDAVAKVLSVESYGHGESVIRQGDDADAVYFTVAGSATVTLNLTDGRRHRLATIGPGAAFGELALLDAQPRTADVDADGRLTCAVLRIEDLMLLDETAPGVRGKLMEQLARDLAARLRRADLEILTLAS